MWILLAFGSAFFAGITAILAKIGIKNTDSNLATAVRTIVILAFSWLMVFIVGSQNMIYQISAYSILFLILSGLATGGSWLFYFKALQAGNVNKVTPIDKLSTVLTMALAFLLLGENITLIKFIGMCAIGIGTYMMIAKKEGVTSGPKVAVETNGTVETSGIGDVNKAGETNKTGGMGETNGTSGNKWLLYAMLSAIFASLTSILGKVGIIGIESNLGTAIRTIVVLIMAWIVVFVSKKQGEIKSIDKKSALFICLSGITAGSSWLCYYKALQTGPASVVVPIDKLSIAVSIAFSYFILKEKLTKKSFIGLTVIVAGTLLLLVK